LFLLQLARETTAHFALQARFARRRYLPHQIMTFAIWDDHLDFHSSAAFDATEQLGQGTVAIVVHG
jgi:hypothetical protein